MITIVGIPFGLQTLKMASLSLWPFGRDTRVHAQGIRLPVYLHEYYLAPCRRIMDCNYPCTVRLRTLHNNYRNSLWFAAFQAYCNCSDPFRKGYNQYKYLVTWQPLAIHEKNKNTPIGAHWKNSDLDRPFNKKRSLKIKNQSTDFGNSG